MLPLPFSSRRGRSGLRRSWIKTDWAWPPEKARRLPDGLNAAALTRPGTRSRRMRSPLGIARSSTSVESASGSITAGRSLMIPAARRVPSCRYRDEFDRALGRHRRQFQRVALEPVAEVEPPQVPPFPPSEPTKTHWPSGLMATVFSGSRPDRMASWIPRATSHTRMAPSPPTVTRRWPSGLNARARTSPWWLGRSARSPGRSGPRTPAGSRG